MAPVFGMILRFVGHACYAYLLYDFLKSSTVLLFYYLTYQMDCC